MIETKQNTPMKTRTVTWMVALALTGICAGQLQTEAERKLNEDYDKSVKKTIAAYPDFEKPDSAFYKKIAELDRSLEAAGDPLYNSADKPMILAERAAKDLNIVPIKTLAAEPDWVKEPGWDHYKPKASKYEDEVIPEFFSYKSVRIRKVEPDGLRIIHEFGAAKIPIENLTEEQRVTYGLTVEGAAQYRRLLAANNAAYYASQQEAARQAQVQAQADAQAAVVAAQAAAAQEVQNRANQPVAQAPVWKRFVTNDNFRKANRADIADEIRRQDGDAAAERFLTEERLKDLEGSIKGGRRAAEQSNEREENMRRQIEMQQQKMERKQREIERQQEEIERRQREIEWQKRQ